MGEKPFGLVVPANQSLGGRTPRRFLAPAGTGVQTIPNSDKLLKRPFGKKKLHLHPNEGHWLAPPFVCPSPPFASTIQRSAPTLSLLFNLCHSDNTRTHCCSSERPTTHLRANYLPLCSLVITNHFSTFFHHEAKLATLGNGETAASRHPPRQSSPKRPRATFGRDFLDGRNMDAQSTRPDFYFHFCFFIYRVTSGVSLRRSLYTGYIL